MSSAGRSINSSLRRHFPAAGGIDCINVVGKFFNSHFAAQLVSLAA